MMEPAQPGTRDDSRGLRRSLLDWTRVRRIFFQRVVNAVVVVVVHVLTEESNQVSLAQRDHMIQQLAATASDPTFRRAILPGSLHGRAFRLEPC